MRGSSKVRTDVTQSLSENAVKLFDATKIPLLNRALDAYGLRHRTIATNIANITTPGYQAKRVSFEEELSGALGPAGVQGVLTHKHHMPIGRNPLAAAQPLVEQAGAAGNLQGDPMASGINNVDLDNEMAELAKNQLRYKFSSRLLADTFRGIQKSIRGTV